MRPEPTSTVVRAKLAELAKARKASLAGLSRMLRQPDRYLDRYVREDYPARLKQDEVKILATFFGVPAWVLGGFIAPGL